MECIRTRTVSLTFLETKPPHDFLPTVLKLTGILVEDIEVLQEEFGGKMVHVKLRKGEENERKIIEILKKPTRTVRRNCDGELFRFALTENGAPVNVIKVKNLPPEAGMSALENALSEYGQCVELSWDRFKSGPFQGIRNGTRVAIVALFAHVPSYIEVAGFEVAVEYAGQPRTCRVCDSPEHLRANCPRRYERGGKDAADAALPDDGPAGDEEEEEEGGESQSVPRAASEPPPTTTSADVMLPAADAPLAAATSPRADTSQAEPQQPAAGEQTTAGGEARVLEGADGVKEFGQSLLDFSEVLKNGNKKKRGASGSPDGGGVQTRRGKKKPALKRY